MKIAVIISQVPDTNTKIKLNSEANAIDESEIDWIINPYAEFAVEKALLLKESGDVDEIIVFAEGNDETISALRSALAMGADEAVLIKTDNFSPAKLAEEIKSREIDLILAAKKSIDHEASWLEAAVAAELDLPIITDASKISWSGTELEVKREFAGDIEVLGVSAPALITCDKGEDEPRYASVMGLMKAKKKPLSEVEVSTDFDLTKLINLKATLPAPKTEVKIFGGSPQEAAKELLEALRNEAKVI
jgi:electron transfer flavoprotein beta subunit